ncbi:Retrotransposon gag domain [Sesbania bispinosa]|nr:Retrotransposon gag domain [Sesbania bispinosa]
MEDYLSRVTPRRLSFSLEDFPEMDNGRHGVNETVMNQNSNNGRGNPQSVTPVMGEAERREELNLLSGMDMPKTTTNGEIPHEIIPTDVLNSIMENQQNLVSLVTSLRTRVAGENLSGFSSRAQGHAKMPPKYQEDALVTQGELRNNNELRLNEFSKSLSGRAFTWYVKLCPYSIKSWEEMAMEFCGKFLEEEGALHIMDLGRVKQKAREGLVVFIKRYRDRALQCKETLPEADLVYGCIKNIEDGSQIFLSLGGITTFAELMRKGADVAEAMKIQGKRKQPASQEIHVKRDDLPPLPINRKQTCQLVGEWLKDDTIQSRVNRPHLSKEQYDDPQYFILHRTKEHTTTECWTIKRTLLKQVRAGKVLLPEKEKMEGDLHRRPLLDHGVNVISSSDRRIRIEEIEEEDDTEERALTMRLAKTRGFRVLFSQLGLNQHAQQKAAKALVEIVKNYGGELSAANAPLTRITCSHATTILFREPSLVILPLKEEVEDWRKPILEQLRQRASSKVAREYRELKGTLYRKSAKGLLMKCVLSREEIQKTENLYHAVCGEGAPSLYRRMQRVGIYWPTMRAHCEKETHYVV